MFNKDNMIAIDKHSKTIKIGDEVFSDEYGLCKIDNILNSSKIEDTDKYLELIRSNFTMRVVNSKNVELIRSWKQLYQNAIDVQDACNLSGVVHSFSKVIREIRIRLDAEGKGGTEALNTHTISVLYADKIKSLTGENFRCAYETACEFAK